MNVVSRYYTHYQIELLKIETKSTQKGWKMYPNNLLRKQTAQHSGSALYWCTYTEYPLLEIRDLMQGFTVSQVTNNVVYVCIPHCWLPGKLWSLAWNHGSRALDDQCMCALTIPLGYTVSKKKTLISYPTFPHTFPLISVSYLMF